ncbi:MAG: sulfite exporter TauE/SafE family protein [Pseudomonadota bacterium]|nr:sulfite exporter TauE/SafE family protein [Pseudomonadota bacterium]
MMELLSITPEINGWVFIGFTALSAFTSAFGVVAGLGGGVLMIGVMAMVFPPVALIPVHGVVQAGTNLTRVIIMHRLIIKQSILPFAIGGVLGATVGGNIVVVLPVAIMHGVLGAFLMYVCWAPKITAGKPTTARFFFLGCVGSLISMFVGATGTILSPWVRGVSEDRREFVATHAAIMLFMHSLKVVVFAFLGFKFLEYLPLMICMVLMSFVGNWVGVKLLSRMREEVFRKIFQVTLTLLALRLLWGAASTAGYL